MADTRKAVLAAQLAKMPARPFTSNQSADGQLSGPTPRPTNYNDPGMAKVGNPRGFASVDLPNSPAPERMRFNQELIRAAGPMGNMNMDVALENSPDPKRMQDILDMRHQNMVLGHVQAAGAAAWDRIKSGKGTSTDAMELAMMVNRGLDGGAPEGDWPKMQSYVKKHYNEKKTPDIFGGGMNYIDSKK